MGETEAKRKRGRKPKTPISENLEIPPTSTSTAIVPATTPGTTSTPVLDDVFSVSNVEILDTGTPTDRHRRRRPGRPPKKLPKNSDKPEKPPAKAPGRRPSRPVENGDFALSTDLVVGPGLGADHGIRWESVERVMPAMDSVVKVFCVHTEPNFSLPWQRKRQYSSSSSGFVISGKRVLTNAHSVEHYTQVKLKKRGSDTKYLATVLAIGTECDIAMLTVDDDEFWQGVYPVEFGDLPTLQDAVTVVGYPIGGDTISVTSGVVSRIEILSYVYGSTELLGLQIDAAINSGFPILGIEWQKMENPDLRKSMGMKPDQKGVRIKRIDPTTPEAQVLKPSDIILSFDIPFRHGERIGFSYLISQKYTGDNAAIRVLRNSEILNFDIELVTHKRLIPAHNRGRPPSYYIIAGFVFTTVSVPYLRSEYGKDYEYEAPVKLLDKLLHSLPESPNEQLVVVSQVLVADINIGYEDIVNTQVLAFNGKPVKNLRNLANMVESCNDEFLRFDLEYQQIVVLRTKTANDATLDILATHCIPSAMSDDLKT
ncbi:hypothetical protein F8388_012309 [Cannabis sativa]|uniref:Protease Do-like PDZ domain-containing protein n=1 Tax=Cannabis sativa TaxID=3483 RepID=A0A7J6EET0_CANSA|nr:hypothetical protein F8388_012309 [Cannabis sativa]